ncbi:DUF3472 domain-containing protein [Flavobacterium nitrogenifigens]|uniref:DUF5077 domain-containing protein n=1 Tax=Flavobacterium nitrogenifigens TaxID=1617283 RepID=A0A521AQU1_9FLAO|nr:DUF3472 domain-containing protein [Flavobacterium nitrogenifigens]KAF2329334.1 DUF3472 domain-containing protein [Flavobacterium nitrogenifigens]SMO37020.1 protein of unknown function [Flavobacterium nitrogenifigens]
MKKITYLLLALVLISFSPIKDASFVKRNIIEEPKTKISLPLAGNAFSSEHIDGSNTITDNGIENWTNPNEFFTLYFKISKPGIFQFTVEESVEVFGKSEVEFSINSESKKVTFSSSKKAISIGTWTIKKEGYVALKIKGISKTGDRFPSINRLEISSKDFDGRISYVPNNEGNFYHWGRRGPSVHLNYQVPENVNAEWYYNEITVPKNEDKIGSYFMANGFGEGYFGIQVNSATERRILFSVWSPFETDDPKSIPDSQKIKMLKKGEDVHAGEFGSEGSGGQSYLKYNWKAGTTYKFLLRGFPENNNSTTYTAYFYAPELKKWVLIASFNRPQTHTYLKRFHSFLENFIPEQGNLSRKVLFNNQWVCDEKGNWTEVNSARFTTDNTGAKGYRMDFAGGLENDSFYLKDGGFFDAFTTPKTIFTRPLNNKKPEINFNTLP